MTYASETTVSVSKTQAAIADLVRKYDGGGYAFGEEESSNRAMVMFKRGAYSVRFILPLPKRTDFAKRSVRGYTRPCTPEQQYALWEQACRSRWRSLYLVIKAKLEAVACGITTFETEFLAQLMTDTGETVGERMIPELPTHLSNRGLLALPGGAE